MSSTIPSKPMRRIEINSSQKVAYPDNSIKTAKYNIFTFLPLAIIIQFKSYFNMYFLFTAILLSIKEISPVDPISNVFPFIFVMAISIIREAIEDNKKAKYDKTYNNSTSFQYNQEVNSCEKVKWKDINVGRIIKVMKNEVIPADLLVIKSSSLRGFCYLETSNLDGESALKPRETPIIFQKIIKSESDMNIAGYIEVDPPDKNIYRVEGAIYIAGNEKYFFNINHVLLRGGSLKNVDYIYGIVIYTGSDTKIMKNIQRGSAKLSKIEEKLNSIVIFLILITVFICLLCTTLGILFMEENKPDYPNNHLNMEMIFYNTSNSDNFLLELFKTFTSFFAIFNTIVPISLMISIEVIKGIQVSFLESDELLRIQPEEKCEFISMKLHEDLGNVTYVFTDKTGTLTKNEMQFKACTIFTRLFDTIVKDQENPDSEMHMEMLNQTTEKSIFAKDFEKRLLIEALKNDESIDFVDEMNCPFLTLKEPVMEFFLNIAINHNVLTEIDPITKENYYSGTNPDEIVLVQAAKELGIEFIERIADNTRVEIFKQSFVFEVLYRFEFTSSRMRSSIIVRDPFGFKKLYIKGADTVILKKINAYSKDNLYKSTKDDMDKFAKVGLRTLCFAMKILNDTEFVSWEEKFKKIQSEALLDKTIGAKLDEVIGELEDDMLLIGVSALEDRLQDEVKSVINDCLEAGINVWMLTGDKLDTAESIGYSCRLFNNDTEVFKIKASEKNETLQQINEIIYNMDKMEKELIEFKLENRLKKKNGGTKKEPNPDKLILKQNAKGQLLDKDNVFYPKSNSARTGKGQDKKKSNRVTLLNPLHHKPHQQTKEINHGDSVEEQIIPQKEIKVPASSRPRSGVLYHSKPVMLDINQMKNQIKVDNMKFIGSNVNKNNNIITLNFIKKASEKLDSSNNKSRYTPVLSVRELRSSNVNKFSFDPEIVMANPCIKENKQMQISEPSNQIQKSGDFLNNHIEMTQDDYVNDVSIIKFMADRQFFQDSNIGKYNNSLTFLNAILSQKQMNDSQELHEPAHNDSHMLDKDDKGNEINKMQDNVIYNGIGKDIHIYNHNENSLQLSNSDDQFNFTNLYQHYKRQIKDLSNRRQKRYLNFTFTKESEEKESQDIAFKNFGLMIEGIAISNCLTKEIAPQFWEILQRSRSVICCRCSPGQKSDVVAYIKEKSKKVTLAIGDGGNDVNMIKTANIGIGIYGKEGHQAAYSADYAISQFKYLRRLIFVHGRYALLRNSYFIYVFFYKNLIFTLGQLWFSFNCAISGTLLWDDWYYMGYNSFLTTIPPGCRMLFEEDIDITFEGYPNRETLLDLVPDIYKEYRDSTPFNMIKFFFVFFGGLIHSCMIYYIPYKSYSYSAIDPEGRGPSLLDHSLTSFVSLIITIYYVFLQDTAMINMWSTIIHMYYFYYYYSLQIIGYFAFALAHNTTDAYLVSGRLFDIIDNLHFWFTVILTCSIAIIPFHLMRRYESLFSNTIVNNLLHNEYQSDYAKKTYIHKLSQMLIYKRSLAKFKNIYKKNSNYEPENQADKKIKEMVDTFKTTHCSISNTKKNETLKSTQLLERMKSTLLLNKEHSKKVAPLKISEINDIHNISSVSNKINEEEVSLQQKSSQEKMNPNEQGQSLLQRLNKIPVDKKKEEWKKSTKEIIPKNSSPDVEGIVMKKISGSRKKLEKVMPEQGEYVVPENHSLIHEFPMEISDVEDV